MSATTTPATALRSLHSERFQELLEVLNQLQRDERERCGNSNRSQLLHALISEYHAQFWSSVNGNLRLTQELARANRRLDNPSATEADVASAVATATDKWETALRKSTRQLSAVLMMLTPKTQLELHKSGEFAGSSPFVVNDFGALLTPRDTAPAPAPAPTAAPTAAPASAPASAPAPAPARASTSASASSSTAATKKPMKRPPAKTKPAAAAPKPAAAPKAPGGGPSRDSPTAATGKPAVLPQKRSRVVDDDESDTEPPAALARPKKSPLSAAPAAAPAPAPAPAAAPAASENTYDLSDDESAQKEFEETKAAVEAATTDTAAGSSSSSAPSVPVGLFSAPSSPYSD